MFGLFLLHLLADLYGDGDGGSLKLVHPVNYSIQLCLNVEGVFNLFECKKNACLNVINRRAEYCTKDHGARGIPYLFSGRPG